jgi:hypothetical protein
MIFPCIRMWAATNYISLGATTTSIRTKILSTILAAMVNNGSTITAKSNRTAPYITSFTPTTLLCIWAAE